MTEISKEYASALFSLAREQGNEEEVRDGLRLVASAFGEVPDYTALLSSPNIPAEERCAMLSRAFDGRVPEYVLSFVQLLCKRNHIRFIGECVNEYEALFRALASLSTARVVSAVALTDEEKKALTKKLEKLSGHRVTMQYEIDETILGGLIVYMDDKVIDGSLRRKIQKVKEVIGT